MCSTTWRGEPRGTWTRDVAAPALLFYGTVDARCPAERHGQWYADRIAGSELVVVPSAGHLDVIEGFWPEVLAGLLRIWGPPVGSRWCRALESP